MVRFGLTTAVALVAFAASGTSAQAQVTFQEAFAIAQKAVPGGTLFKARIEQANTIFGFYFEREGKINEVEVSKRGGKIVKQKESNNGPGNSGVSEDVLALIQKNAKAKTKLPIGRLYEIASESLKDTPFSGLTFDKDGDRLVVKVGEEIVINAETGDVTRTPKK